MTSYLAAKYIALIGITLWSNPMLKEVKSIQQRKSAPTEMLHLSTIWI